MKLSIRKVSPDEARDWAFGPNVKTGPQSDDIKEAISDMRPGEAAAIDLTGVTKRALKRRVTVAAKSLGGLVRWAKNEPEDAVIFQVREVAQPRQKRPYRRKAA